MTVPSRSGSRRFGGRIGPLSRCLGAVVTLLLLLASWSPGPVGADINDPWVIDPEVLLSTGIPAPSGPHTLMVQATSWPGSPYRYVLLVGDFTPWPITSLRILDRYFSGDPGGLEHVYEWVVDRLEPGKTTSAVIEYPDGPLAGGCHQLEINAGNVFHAILMDCAPPGAFTLWNLPLREEMALYLADPGTMSLPAPAGESKLGLHVSSNSSPVIMDFVRRAHPAVLVAVEDLGWLAEAKAVSPRTITLGRFIEGNQSIEGDPAVRAREFVRTHAGRYLAYPGVDYWLGWNEPVIDSRAQMEWYAAFESERVLAVAELGLKVAVGNFSAGTPEADEFEAFVPALLVARSYGGIFALHEYSAPSMRDGVGSAIPGLDPQAEQGALTLRYRNWYNNLLRVRKVVLPLVITEAGIDGGVLGLAAGGRQGWRDFTSAGSSGQPPSAAVAEYLAQLSWYDDELRRDPYVLGFAVFNAGDSRGQWQAYDVMDILSQLANMVAGKR